ncbi:MAG: hypothetical protein NZ990_14685 [Myxococcota bacterium]|nr:hypothetical protein [Myxococcota bacterium]
MKSRAERKRADAAKRVSTANKDFSRRPGPETRAALLCLAIAWLAGLGCAAQHPAITSCQDQDEAHAICGLQNPEDLALVPGGGEVVISQFGAMDGTRPGSLALFDVKTEAVRIAFEGGGAPGGRGEGSLWGDPGCPGPPEAGFSPHGIDLEAFPGRGLRLLVVNHGGREAVEFFAVERTPSGTEISWRGCAPAPPDAFLNDVVNLPDGGFLVTQMMSRGEPLWGLVKSSMGFDTGFVYEWQPGHGYAVVPGTSAPFPNGIELSPDARRLYLNVYSPGEVRQIDRTTGESLGTADVPSPDNVTWGSDGRLLVASHRGGLSDQLACMDLEQGACGMEFAVVAVEPETMETETLLLRAGPPMGAGTVALDLGDGELLIGSFASDRMLRIPAAR